MPGQVLLCVVMTTVVFSGCPATKGSPCDGVPGALVVDYTARTIFSPGYPGHYENNLRCDWVFEASRDLKAGFGIQLATLEIELDPSYATTTGECDDYLEAFEGAPSNLGSSLGRWCGRTLRVIKTMSTSVTLRFSTNSLYTGRGFVIEYSLIRVDSAECVPGNVTVLRVGHTSLYESFDVKNAEGRCTWNVEAVDDFGNTDLKSSLVIESFNIPQILCENGRFIVYDGQSTSSHMVLEWCDVDQPFSKIYLSSCCATLTFIFKEGEELDSEIDTIQLKLYSRTSHYTCNDTNLSSIDVDLDPVYFSLPFSQSPSGGACDVHVSQRVRDSVRVDVLSIDGQAATCDSDFIIVRQASTDTEVEKSCNRRHYPMYLPFQSDVIVNSKHVTNRVYLKAISSDQFCDGREVSAVAYDSFVTEKVLPKDSDVDNIQNNCYSKHVIKTNGVNQAISLNIQWDPPADVSFSDTDACEGDFVNIYDGEDESAPLLFSSCKKSDMADGYVNTRIISTKESMLLLYNGNEGNDHRHVSVEFHSLPANTVFCESMYEITVNGTAQNLTSPNYPQSFPLDYSCTWKVTANESEVIVVEVVDTSFPPGCGDIVTIYDGGSSVQPGNILGHICGEDVTHQKFTSKKHEMIVKFISNKFGPNSGGWKLLLYSEPTAAGGTSRGNGRCMFSIFLLVFCLVVVEV